MKARKLAVFFLMACLTMASGAALAEDYVIDTKNSHAFIQFKIPHLGYSYLLGRFNRFSGTFSYDEKNPAASGVSVTIDAASVDTNHPERDKHLRDKDFLYVKEHPTATFKSTSVVPGEDGRAVIKGLLTLRGVTREIAIEARHVGSGKDPWGGFRRGFEGSTTLVLSDYGITFDLGPASKAVELYLSFEGIRQ